MVYGVYVLYDGLALEGSPPFLAVTPEVAVRSFRQSLNTLPEISRMDYTLVHIATYDSVSTALEPVERQIIAEGSNYIGGSK